MIKILPVLLAASVTPILVYASEQENREVSEYGFFESPAADQPDWGASTEESLSDKLSSLDGPVTGFSCAVTWEASGVSRTFYGGGVTKSVAIANARRECLLGAVPPWNVACRMPPKSARCTGTGSPNRCISSMGLYRAGYPGSGHKTNYCRAQGFDSYDPGRRQCHRSCPGTCTKVAIKSLGWRGGHKNNFCIARGYEGVHNYGEYSNGGYCFLRPDGVDFKQCNP